MKARVIMDYVYLGSTPSLEKAPQVGTEDHFIQPVASVWKKQLSRFALANKINVRFILKAESHDFGTYYEVCVPCKNEKDFDLACDIENNVPEYWDDEAKLELNTIWWNHAS